MPQTLVQTRNVSAPTGQSQPPTAGRGGQNRFAWGFLLLLTGGLIGAGLTRLLSDAPPAAATSRSAAPLPLYGNVADFELEERNGAAVSRDDLLGRVWVADFFFTSCAGICPMMSTAMARLQQRVIDNPEVTLVSFSVDPERDTPARLRAYAQRYDADPVRWWFLTGEKRTIYEVSRSSFRLSVEETPEEQRGPETEDVLHSSKFVLIDRKGRIRGYYDGDLPETVDTLADDIARLLKD